MVFTMPNYASVTVIVQADIVRHQRAMEALVQDSHAMLLGPNGDALHPASTKTSGTMHVSCAVELASQLMLLRAVSLQTTNCVTMELAVQQTVAMCLLHLPAYALTLRYMSVAPTVPTVLIVMTDVTAPLISVCWIVVVVISSVGLILPHTLRQSKQRPS